MPWQPCRQYIKQVIKQLFIATANGASCFIGICSIELTVTIIKNQLRHVKQNLTDLFTISTYACYKHCTNYAWKIKINVQHLCERKPDLQNN